MHRFPHGIRRPFLRTVGPYLGSCLGLNFLLQSSVDREEEADNTKLQPVYQKGVLAETAENEDLHIKINGDFQPTKRDEDEADNADLQPAYKVGHTEEKGASQPAANGADNEDLQPLPKGQDNGFLLPKQRGDDEDQPEAVNLDLHPLLQGDKNEDDKGDLLPLTGEDYQQEGNNLADSVNMNLLPHLQSVPIEGQSQEVGALPMQADDGFILPPRGVVLSKGCSTMCSWYAYTADFYAHQHLRRTFVHAINAWVLPSPRPRVKMKGEQPLHNVHAWEHDAWACPPSPSTSSLILIVFTAQFHDKLTVPTMPFILLRVRRRHQVRERHSGESVATHFLIPLRGSVSMQWNDEEFVEDVAAQKMKTKQRMMVLRLFYLMKDLLDPG